jgi:iron complex outermembrane recepter protein
MLPAALIGMALILLACSDPHAMAVDPEKKGTINGLVTDKSKKPIEEVMVDRIKTPEKGPHSDVMDVTNAQGRYNLPGLKPGAYTLRFSFPGYKSVDKKVEVMAGKTVTVDIVLEKG